MLEGNIQNKVINFLKKEGYKSIKLIKTNTNGIPDLLILMGDGKHFWIEMKQEGKNPTEIQKYRKRELEKIGDISLVCRGFKDFKEQYLKLNLSQK